MVWNGGAWLDLLNYGLIGYTFLPWPWSKFRYHKIRPMFGRASRPLPSR